jgi:hypothetical protein
MTLFKSIFNVVKLLFIVLFSLSALAVLSIVVLFFHSFIGCDSRKSVWDEVMFQTRPGMTCEEVFEKVLDLTKWQEMKVWYETDSYWTGNYSASNNEKDCPGIKINASYEYDGFLKFENVEFVFDY